VVADAAHAAVVGDHAATVTVDQPEDEFFGGLVDECFLPRLECDASVVLAAGTVLGGKAWRGECWVLSWRASGGPRTRD
jgi:hypothetical protein